MIPTSVRIFVCTEPQDMRRGFDRLALAAREASSLDPEHGAMFVFANRNSTRLKILWWDGNGYCVLYKRLHRALFRLPTGNGKTVSINGSDLARLIRGIAKPSRRRRARDRT